MKSLFSKFGTHIRKIDPKDVWMLGGICLVGVGIGIHDVGAGLSTVGGLMLLSLIPLSRWIK